MSLQSTSPSPLIYYAVDQGETIESLAALNKPLRSAKLEHITIDNLASQSVAISRRTALHRWWNHEVMVCNLGGIFSTKLSPSTDISLPYYNPDLLCSLKKQGFSGVVRGYAGLKYLDLPIVNGHTSGGCWNEEFCDDTRLILLDCEVEGDGIPAYFATLDGLRDFFLDDQNDDLARDLAECTMLEFLLEGVKIYHELSEKLSISTSEIVIENIIESSRVNGWGATIANIRNVYTSPDPVTLSSLLNSAANATVTHRSTAFHNIIKSEWYECADAVISMMKSRATVMRNGNICSQMANCVRGNQWFSKYYDCDVVDEIGIEEWTSLCGFSPEMHSFATSDMSEYLTSHHLASDTSNMAYYSGRSYTYHGLTVSKPQQYEYLQSEPHHIFNLSSLPGEHRQSWSLLINVNRCELVVVSTRLASRLKRFIGSITVTLKLPIVEVSRTGEFKEGSGPGPNVILRRIMDGKYSREAIKWVLSHIFLGHLFIRSSSPIRGFLPNHCFTDSAPLVMTQALRGSLLQDYKIVRKRSNSQYTYYWAPQRVGNLFQVIVGKSLVRLKETERDIVDDDCCVVRMASHKLLW